MSLARYNSDGTLDTTFNPEGKIPGTNYDGESIEIFNEVAIQADGKIVAAGGTDFLDHSTSFRILRYDSHGLPDASFGRNGVVEYQLQNFTRANAYAMAIQPWDQRIVAAGKSGQDLGLIRLNPDGSLDTSFDGDGKLTTVVAASGGWADSIAVLDDHKILVVGTALRSPEDADFMLAQYNPDGSLDNTFGDGGVVITDFRSELNGAIWEQARDVTVQADGRIVVVGYTSKPDPGGGRWFSVTRYNSDGSLDSTFAGDGMLIANRTSYGGCGISSDYYSVALQSDNKIVALVGDQCKNLMVVRVNPDGSTDTTFNSGEEISGWKQIEFAPWPWTTGGFDLVVQPDGKIVIGGTAVNNAGPGNANFAVARLNADGSLDFAAGDFDNNGRIDAADIDLLSVAIRTLLTGEQFDLNGDRKISQEDRLFLIHSILNISIGDANLDGAFTSKDLVQLFVAAQYEDDLVANSGWATGDFNGDSEFTSADLVFALQDGSYEQPAAIAGDLEVSQRISAVAVDRLAAAIHPESTASRCNLDADSRVTQDDHRWLVKNILGTTYGDANLDGVFDSKDLVDLFASGQYEDNIPHNSGWATGDWNCDGDFTTADLVLALQEGGYVGDIEP
jgi:uncharacterized delta-60 repeat protein